ncbi:MAG: bile acid:sodium symporter family protein [Pirellulaceae bacterium]|nr:bile acid:sodium symporter family protein [Pirellulaceae bacterium]
MSIDDAQLQFDSGGLGLLNGVIALIMFGVALDMRPADFRRIAEAPLAPFVGLLAQFVLLPAMSFLLTFALQVSPSLALGMILVAACPGGNLSNFLTHLAGGTTVLSVTMTAVSTALAIVMTPLNLAFWGGLRGDTAAILQQVRLEPIDLLGTIAVILGLPLVAGMLCARALPELANRLHRPLKIFSILFFVCFVGFVFSRNFHLFWQWIGWIALAVAVQNALALGLGYFSGTAVGLPEQDRRALALEVGIQNSALGLSLIFTFFSGLGGMALIAGWWGIWHILTGLPLALFWSRRPANAIP